MGHSDVQVRKAVMPGEGWEVMGETELQQQKSQIWGKDATRGSWPYWKLLGTWCGRDLGNMVWEPCPHL